MPTLHVHNSTALYILHIQQLCLLSVYTHLHHTPIVPEYGDDVEYVNSLVDTIFIVISTMPHNILQYKKRVVATRSAKTSMYIYIYIYIY
jgi:hypothetical protein